MLTIILHVSGISDLETGKQTFSFNKIHDDKWKGAAYSPVVGPL